eukprot:539938-Prymnesium_polylepis.1
MYSLLGSTDDNPDDMSMARRAPPQQRTRGSWLCRAAARRCNPRREDPRREGRGLPPGQHGICRLGGPPATYGVPDPDTWPRLR